MVHENILSGTLERLWMIFKFMLVIWNYGQNEVPLQIYALYQPTRF